MTAADAQPSERADFIRRTYLHLGGAVLGFTALEALLLRMPGIENLVGTMMGGRLSWMVVLGAFMVVSWVADSWARSSTSLAWQYAGLSLYVVAEAVIFLPLLYIAQRMSPDIIPEAGLITLLLFGGLTAVVAISKVDFSFLRMGLTIAGFAALGIIVCSAIFGFDLGILFTAAMLVLASGYILYHTSNVLHVYRTDQYVAAALALFASVALLFWYVLRLLMEMNRR
jgi:FtsH-binding integral membrane protein